MKIRITETIRKRDQKIHSADAILLIISCIELIEILKVHKIDQPQLSESNEVDRGSRRHQKFRFGPAHSYGGLQGRNTKHENKVPLNSRDILTVLTESGTKENLAKTVSEICEKESSVARFLEA